MGTRISLLVSVSGLVLGAALVALAQSPFLDTAGSVHEQDIVFIAEEGITRGCNPPVNDRFCPKDVITRGQMAAMLVRGLHLPPSTEQMFTDAQGVFRGDINSLGESGISRGCNPPRNDRFCPESPVTRAQMASFLVRAFGLAATASDYFDDDRGSVHEADINALARAGVTAGCGTRRFCPDSPVTREQMASFLTRALTGKGVPLPDPGGTPGASPPPGAIHVKPGTSLQKVLDSNRAGRTYYLTAGIHRLSTVIPKDGDVFVGAPGAVMSGAKLLKDFNREGDLWVATGQTQQGEVTGQCEGNYTGCRYPEQLFIDGKRLWQVTSKTAVKPGRWFFDYEANKIYFADRPIGKTVETSVAPQAFGGNARGVVIRDLIIEKYASPAQKGAVEARAGKNWTIESSWILFNHGSGIRVGGGMTIRGVRVNGNGQIGINGQGSGLRILDSEISHNQLSGFEAFGWVGGGVKINASEKVTVRGNVVKDNKGHGLHTDGGSKDVLYDRNTITDNDGVGISHEIGYDAIIRANTVRGNGFGRSLGLGGAGIFVNSSSNVEVYGNTVVDNADGIGGQQSNRAGHILENLWVHDNVIRMSDGSTGIATFSSDDAVFTSRNNRFDRNDYRLGSLGKEYFKWENSELTFSGWQAAGNDRAGSATKS